MSIVEFESRVGPDGVLKLAVPVGAQNANRDVKVTISQRDPAPRARYRDESEWRAFISQTAGSIQDPTFVRPPQGEFEDRGEIFP